MRGQAQAPAPTPVLEAELGAALGVVLGVVLEAVLGAVLEAELEAELEAGRRALRLPTASVARSRPLPAGWLASMCPSSVWRPQLVSTRATSRVAGLVRAPVVARVEVPVGAPLAERQPQSGRHLPVYRWARGWCGGGVVHRLGGCWVAWGRQRGQG